MGRYILIGIFVGFSMFSFAENNENLKEVVDIVLFHEGERVVKTRKEFSKYGIRNFLLLDYNKKMNKNYELRTLTKKQAQEISLYLIKEYRIDEIKSFNLQLLLFDTFFNAGYGNASKITQKAINLYYEEMGKSVHVDGIFGSNTIKILNNLKDEDRFYKDFLEVRLESYKGYSSWKTYGKGWEKRIMSYSKIRDEKTHEENVNDVINSLKEMNDDENLEKIQIINENEKNFIVKSIQKKDMTLKDIALITETLYHVYLEIILKDHKESKMKLKNVLTAS
nr:hypothetical protein [uncultured Cetobacterium sp.]